MSRAVTFFAVTLLLACPMAAATQCNLTMTLNCTNGICTSTTLNSGSAACTGQYVALMAANVDTSQATVTNFHTNLGGASQCFDTGSFPVGEPLGFCVV